MKKRYFFLLVGIILLAFFCKQSVLPVRSIKDTVALVDKRKLVEIIAVLTEKFGPRHASYDRPFVDEACTFSQETVYPENNLIKRQLI